MICPRFPRDTTGSESNGSKVGTLVRRRAQPAINFPLLTSDKKHEVDLKAAMWCYKSSYPFNMYESPDAQDFIHDINPAYDPPNRRALSGRLLDEVYASVKARSDTLITNLDHINVSTDESTNINANRIANISV
jgi:hypothetical protein